jgi:hypothetical protein
MKKEYRAELKSLRKNRRVVTNDWKAFVKSKRAELRKFTTAVNRAERGVVCAVSHFDKRIAILEGRLS